MKVSRDEFLIEYQFRMNDLYNLMGADMVYYSVVQSHLTTLEMLLAGSRQIRWNRKTDKLYMDTDWDKTFNPGDYLVAEAWALLDPSSYPEVYDDMFLKKYATALIKRQWGANLSKFNGVATLGGVSMNGEQIYSQAIEEIQRLEEEIKLTFETPIDYMIG